MLVIGRVYKMEVYVDKNGTEQKRITLLDETPDGKSVAQFFNFVAAEHEFVTGQFVQFEGRIISGKGGNSFFSVEKGTLQILDKE